MFGELVAGRRSLLAPEVTPHWLPSAAKAIDDGVLTDGKYIISSFSVGTGRPSSTYCGTWDASSQSFVNDTARGPIVGPGPFQPPESEYSATAARLCAGGAAANGTVFYSLLNGGDNARSLLAALYWGTCSNPTAIPSAVQAFLNLTDLTNGYTAMSVARNFAQAARELGIAACVTVATLDSNVQLVDLETFSSQDAAGGPAPAPAPLPGGGDARLPDGNVLYRVNWAPGTVQCLKYAPDSSSTMFVDDPSAPAWRASGSEQPNEQDIKDFAQEICDASKSPGQDILDALEAGGSEAQVAVAALTDDACNNSTARDAAFTDLFSKNEMNDPSTVLRYISSFVNACDAIGTACCFTVVVLDPSTDAVIDSRTIHTGGYGGRPPATQSPPGGAPPSPPELPPGASGLTLEQCKAQLGTASAGCTGSAIAPGSPCCAAVLGLGSECLAVLAQAASQPGGDPVTQLAVSTLFTQCGVVPGNGPPTPGLAPPSPSDAGGGCQGDPTQAFQSALSSCDVNNVAPGTPCCIGIQALGGACLAQVLAASNGDASVGFLVKGIAGRCQVDLGSPAPPYSSPPPAPLPGGITRIWWQSGVPAYCTTYSPSAGGFVNMTAPTYWNASGYSRPSKADTDPLISQLCQGASAGEAFTQGVGQGGEQALNWVAAFFYTNCPAIMDAFYAFNSNLKSRQPAEAVSYVQKFVEACQELGVGACVTVTSLDSSSGAVLGEVQVHTDVPVSGPATYQRRLHAQPRTQPAETQHSWRMQPRELPV
ncbi:hypothetical protein ABPG77_010943 [Micractinium sp. CCAP 211/92]